MLRKVSFIVAVFGVGFLAWQLVLPMHVFIPESSEDILHRTVINNHFVRLEGEVTSQIDKGDIQLLGVRGYEDITFVCGCNGDLKGDHVYLEGYVSEFLGEKQVTVLSMETVKE